MEESSSYDRTGIPRGDHRRYQSRGVTRVTDDPYTPYEDQSLDTPGKGVVTQAEIQLQRLLGKQLDTNVTLARQFAQHKSFTEGTTFKPFIERAAGQLSLEEFSELQAEEGRLEHLSQCGLTEEEILLKLEHDRKDCPGPEPAKKSKLGMAPAAYAAKLKNIERKIKSREEKLAEKEPETFSHVKVMSRHEMEIEKSLYRGTDRADQLSHLTTREKSASYMAPNHPMNHLDSIAVDLFPKSAKCVRKMKKVKEYKNEDNQEDTVIGPKTLEDTLSMKSQHDTDELIHNITKGCENPNFVTETQEHENVCSLQGEKENTVKLKDFASLETKHPERDSINLDITEKKTSSAVDSISAPTKSTANTEQVLHSCSGHIQLKGCIEIISEEEIVRNRLSLTEIRNIPRFKDYTPGQPNKVLYLKNLSPKVAETDLISLFIRYQQPQGPKILFRLLSGRMKGQAFVTLDSAVSAEKALCLLNGYQMKGKPIIIQYGRHS